MKLAGRSLLVPLALLTCAATAHAQGGCVNSPENPTVLLAAIGCGAAVLSHAVKSLRGKD